MIDFTAPNTEENAKILLQGMWYIELPPILNHQLLMNHIKKVLENIQKEKIGSPRYPYFRYTEDLFIKDIDKIAPPNYIRGKGSEAITYYAFKKNGSLREMQIPNLIHYCSFIYNTLYVFEKLYKDLYLNPAHQNYVQNSDSYVVIDDYFVISTEYESLEEINDGLFTTLNNKIQSNEKFDKSRRHYDEIQEAYLYSVKLDIESFFPNMYTHYMEKIAKLAPYSSIGADERYFKYLDTFFQRINNNQTKGIPAGVFSSHIAAELCMLCVDEEIRKEMSGKDIGYLRFVDDITFFSDNQQLLEEMATSVQRILNKYRLRVNGSKTEYRSNGTFLEKRANKKQILEMFPYLEAEGVTCLNSDSFLHFKHYIVTLLKDKNIPQIKTILTLLLKNLSKGNLQFEELFSWFCYIFILAFENINLACHVYRLLDKIIETAKDPSPYITVLKKKTLWINTQYKDTLFQIWHYYVITKYLNSEEQDQWYEDYISEKDINPVILCFFVKDKENDNHKLVTTIIEQFKEDCMDKDWKSKIMFSKWWLPLLKIKMVDTYNYYKYMNSSEFPQLLIDLITP